MNRYSKAIIKHYEKHWGSSGTKCLWDKGPYDDIADEFVILEIAPTDKRSMWTYATVCMSHPDDEYPLELHLFAPQRNKSHVELLTVIAHYHRNETQLNIDHTVNFGRPWLPGSKCDHGLISLPYLDGPELEILNLEIKTLRFLWLIPITSQELEFKKTNGPEALEQEFDKTGFNYLDPLRNSVV